MLAPKALGAVLVIKHIENLPKILQKNIKNSIIQKYGKMCKYKKKVA